MGNKIIKWLAVVFVTAVFALLSFMSFNGWDTSRDESDNRLIAMASNAQGWLLEHVGAVPAGVIFAVLALAIVVLAVLDGRKPRPND